jgi:hypothetical protein
MLSNEQSQQQDLIILSLVCKGVDLSSTSPLVNNGFLSRVTGGSIPRNVKKLIRVQKSEPFPPGGRPARCSNPTFPLSLSNSSLLLSRSMLYDTIYESEPYEDVAVLMPSLLVEIRNPLDKDCKIRVNVYYSSSLTNGKEILLVATTFGFKEMLRSKLPIFTSQMVSEHCSQAVAYIRRFSPLSPVLHTNTIQSVSPLRSKWNPMFQRYIFHSDIEQNQPVVCEEFTWEPRLTYHVPYKYLLNLSKILTETLTAWKVRSELERARQGKFISRDEAFLNGWYELSICPSSCLLNAVPLLPATTSVDDDYLPSPSLSASASPSFSGEEKGRIRLGSDDSLGSPTGNGTNRQKKASIPGLKQPSCYVEISLEHRSLPKPPPASPPLRLSDLLFSSPVGRTNIEFNTLAPSFGANLNPSRVRPFPLSDLIFTSERA